MPKIVDELPKTERGGRTKKYDYLPALFKELLQNGKAAELVQGEDFDCSGPSMRQLLYKEASEQGLKARVRTRVEPEGDPDGRHFVTFAVEKAKPKKAATNGSAEKPAA